MVLIQKKILKGIKESSLFGMLLCDIETPSHLKPLFAEFCPIFKNAEVSRDDIGLLMKNYAEKIGSLPQPRKMLIGSYFGNKILLITPFVKCFLNLGLVVTTIYEFIEFLPINCFQDFGDRISNARRESDLDPDKAILANLMKLIGNSGYGKTITNIENHRCVKYFNKEEVSKVLNDPLFSNLEVINDDMYEVETFKKSLHFSLPFKIGFFAYSYAKLRMLEFYFDFLNPFVDRTEYQCCKMDTDSLYLALATPSLEEAIKPSKRKEFYSTYHHWFPSESCSTRRSE